MPSYKVLLVAPSNTLSQILTPDLGIGFVASALRRGNFDVEFIDIKRDKPGLENLAKMVEQNDYLMVAVKVFSPFIPQANEVIELVKKIKPDLKVVIGGPHPTYAYKESLNSCTGADAGVIGEAESSIVEIAKAYHAGNSLEGIESVCYRENGELKQNAMRTNFPELDDLPLPAWDLMDPRRYKNFENFWYFHKGKLAANISISRGCPFSCTFCSDFLNYGKKVRYRKISHVMEEIQRLQTCYGVDELHITDSIFTVNRRYVYEFCEALIKRGIKIHWATIDGTRLDTLDAPLLRVMQEAGCYGTSVGIESGSERILKFMKKGITKEKIEEKLNLIKETTNFLVQGYFIIGYPTETRETMQETVDFASRLPLDMAAFSPFRLTPGTAVAKYVEDNEPESAPNWSGQTMERVMYIPKGVTEDELNEFHRKAYRAFYLRPHIIWKYLTMINGTKQLSILFTKFKDRLFRTT